MTQLHWDSTSGWNMSAHVDTGSSAAHRTRSSRLPQREYSRYSAHNICLFSKFWLDLMDRFEYGTGNFNYPPSVANLRFSKCLVFGCFVLNKLKKWNKVLFYFLVGECSQNCDKRHAIVLPVSLQVIFIWYIIYQHVYLNPWIQIF